MALAIPGFFSSDQFQDSLQSAEIDFGGFVLRGVQSIKAMEKVKRDRIYGNGPYPIGLPLGSVEGDLEFVVTSKEADALLQSLGQNYTQTPGTMGINLRRPTDGSIMSVNATSVYLNEITAEFGKAGSSDPSLFTFPAYTLDPVDWNGVTALIPPTTSFSFPISILGF